MVTCDCQGDALQDPDPEFFTLASYNGTTAIQACMQWPSTLLASPAFLIRIELEGMTVQECDHEDPNLISAIVFYNLANAYKYLAATDKESDTTSHLQCAFKLFHLSYSIIDITAEMM